MRSNLELGKQLFHVNIFIRVGEGWDNKGCKKCVGLSMWSVTVARSKSLGKSGGAAPDSSVIIPNSWVSRCPEQEGLSWQCLSDLSLRDLPKHFEQFIPGASTEYPVINPSICTKIIPGFWGFFASF